MTQLTFGTSNFQSEDWARFYYKRLSHSAQDVRRKIASGEISIGRPTLQPGDELSLIPGEGRYQITRKA